ncbi:MAG: TonB-dependent receptor [Gammaproteobacteria bacterium]|nr:TonB-dependent receptor [Gammaproteobacteria bacterium]
MLKNNKRTPRLCCGMIFTTIGLVAMPVGAARAQSGALNETDLLGEIPLQTVVSRFPQTAAHAPASVTVITADMLRAAGAMNWVDVFRLAPGFQAYAPNANRFGIDYHGQGRELPNHLEVMVDGRSVYDPIQSTVVWGALGVDLDDIDRIEIVRGPSAAAHGSNAFTGAVNIITRSAVQDRGTRVRATAGDRGTQQVGVRHSEQTGSFNYRVSLGFDHNNGFPNFNAAGPDDGAETWNLGLRSTYTPNLADTLSFDGGFSRQDTVFGDADRPDEYLPVRYYSQHQRVAWEHQLSDTSDFELTLYHNYLRTYGVRDLGPVSALLGVSPVVVPLLLGIPDQHSVQGFHTIVSERYDLEAVQRIRLSDALTGVWGVGTRWDGVDSRFLFDDGATHDEQRPRLFAQSEWLPTTDLAISTGVMLEKTRIGTLVSPRVSFNYLIHPNHTLRLSNARGQRAPSITEAEERQVFRLGDVITEDQRRVVANLGAERINNLELAYLAHFPEQEIDFDIKLFREEVRDGLDDYRESIAALPPFFDSERLVRDNVARWNAAGAEAQAVYHLSSRTWFRLHYANQDLNSRRVARFDPALQIRNFDGGTPRHSGGLLVNHRWSDALDFGIFVYSQSAVDWRNGNPISGFTRVDAQATWHFKAGSSKGDLQLVAQNLGPDYSEFNRANVFETAVYLRARLDFPD